jgi:hypothetical protein
VVSLDTTTNTLTVLEFDGTTQTFAVTQNTKYFLDGKSATSGAVGQGLNVVVIAPRDWGGAGGGSSTSPTAFAVFLVSPNVLGRITAVNGADLSIVNPQGFAFTVQTSSTTVYYVDGQSTTTPPTFTVNEVIAALGAVDQTNLDQLDATQVNVVPASGHHHKWPGVTTTTEASGPSGASGDPGDQGGNSGGGWGH